MQVAFYIAFSTKKLLWRDLKSPPTFTMVVAVNQVWYPKRWVPKKHSHYTMNYTGIPNPQCTVGSKKTLTNVLFGTVRYPVIVQSQYCYDTIAVLFRYCAVNVQVRYQSGGGSVQFDKSFWVGLLRTRYSAARKCNLILGIYVYTIQVYMCIFLVVETEWGRNAEMSLHTA